MRIRIYDDVASWSRKTRIWLSFGGKRKGGVRLQNGGNGFLYVFHVSCRFDVRDDIALATDEELGEVLETT